MEVRKDKIKEFLNKKKQLIKFLFLFASLVAVSVSLTSIYKQYFGTGSKHYRRQPKTAKAKTHRASVNPAALPTETKRKNRKSSSSAEPKKTHEEKPENYSSNRAEKKAEKRTAENKLNNDIISTLKASKEEAFLYRARKEALKEKLEYLKLKKELQEYSQELVPPLPKPSALDVKLTEIQQKLYDLEREIKEKKNGRKKESLKEKLLQIKQQIQSQMTGAKPDSRNYKLVAILDGEAVVEVDGKEYTVRDGEKLFGQRVEVGDYSVRIGNRILTLDFGGQQNQLPRVSLPFVR